jgi:hypothetical protein
VADLDVGEALGDELAVGLDGARQQELHHACVDALHRQRLRALEEPAEARHHVHEQDDRDSRMTLEQAPEIGHPDRGDAQVGAATKARTGSPRGASAKIARPVDAVFSGARLAATAPGRSDRMKWNARVVALGNDDVPLGVSERRGASPAAVPLAEGRNSGNPASSATAGRRRSRGPRCEPPLASPGPQPAASAPRRRRPTVERPARTASRGSPARPG